MTKPSQFGSEYELSDKFLKDVLKTGILDFVVSQARAKEKVKVQKALSGKKASKLIGIPKLDDANQAGTKESSDCLLILTEGDSAKALAMSGLDVVGRDYYGVFPLRGKLLNVRDASPNVLKNNAEIQAIVKILGLQFDRIYSEVSSLRYGGILIMADQDHDGSHIKGLIINFIHHFWPSLIQLNSFMKEFVTPVIKANRPGEQPISFFTIQDYKNWEESLPKDQPHRYHVR
jgi:DNA topoisomerase-2